LLPQESLAFPKRGFRLFGAARSEGVPSKNILSATGKEGTAAAIAPSRVYDYHLVTFPAESRKENMLKRITIALLLLSSPAFAIDDRFLSSLNKLDPATRLEQVCDLEAMSRIGQADRAKSDVVSHPIHSGNTLTANGGAFRQKGKWHQFSFVCKATPDHLKVISFSYKVGELIPEEKWSNYGLWR
jgi:hypothetical protein